jgi:hypothetical protein
MREIILLQSICMIVPMLLIVGLCLVLNCVLSKQKQIALRFDLTTLLMFVTALGIVWPLSKVMLETPARDQSSGHWVLGFYSMFLLPLVWFFRHLIENHRRRRQQIAARKALKLGARFLLSDSPGEPQKPQWID